MMGTPPRRAGFPPRVGWIPLGIGLVAVTVLSLWGASPQFAERVVGPAGQNAGAGSGNEGAAGGPVAGGPKAGGPANVAGPAARATAAAQVGGAGGTACAAGKNGGSTGPGVTANQIRVASTIVTTGEGSGFLGEAAQGMRAAINEVNNQGGICGRTISLYTLNDGWSATAGLSDIQGFIAQNYFALVGEPDSEGLDAAINSQTIDRAGIPVVGTDGMLKSQYTDPWVWPIASSTVSNMHIVAKYAVDVLKAKSFGIVFDTSYKFGHEGAYAFDQEVKRLTGHDIPGFSDDPSGNSCHQAYCGVATQGTTDFSGSINTFNGACQSSGSKPACDVVVMLLEPEPMETWMGSEANCGCSWYGKLMGGEPLFDDNLGSNCAGNCRGMTVWTGYHPDIQPFSTEPAVQHYEAALKSVCPSCDPHNEFTEGAYLGTQLFIEAAKRVGPNLTRQALQQVLNSQTFDLNLASPLTFNTSLPRVANSTMAAFADNASVNGSFNGWNYLQTGFLADPARGQDLG